MKKVFAVLALTGALLTVAPAAQAAPAKPSEPTVSVTAIGDGTKSVTFDFQTTGTLKAGTAVQMKVDGAVVAGDTTVTSEGSHTAAIALVNKKGATLRSATATATVVVERPAEGTISVHGSTQDGYTYDSGLAVILDFTIVYRPEGAAIFYRLNGETPVTGPSMAITEPGQYFAELEMVRDGETLLYKSLSFAVV